jgi:hypothetical protein
MSQSKKHTWSFSTVGGVKRVNLESGEDLKHLSELDQKLWTALSCPVNGLEIDHRTLSLIDKNNDGQIRVPEVLKAVNWICAVINDPNDLLKQENSLKLSSININHQEGAELLASAKIILKNLGKKEQDFITVEETSNTEAIFKDSKYNGDGIITEVSASENEALKKLISKIIELEGAEMDRSGKPGISAEKIKTFFKHCEDYDQWQKQKEETYAEVMPFGENTPEAYTVFQKLFSKINDYYLRCRLAAFDSETTVALNNLVKRIETIQNKDLSNCLDEIAEYPLAKIEAGKKLPLSAGLNPAWESTLISFKTLVTDHLFNHAAELSENEWKGVTEKFNAYQEWLTVKKGSAVEKLGLEYIRSLLQSDLKNDLLQLVEKDNSVKAEAENIIKVDQLTRYYRDVFRLLKNFVTFYDFYSPGGKGIFQAGTLYIDQRSCDLCLKVSDMGKHTNMANFSGMFLIYCDCISKTTGEKTTIVAALTNGDIDNLVVGRNALFYDRNGKDWDATIVKIIDNPISIRQAFWAPYRKVSRFIENQINKVAAAQDSKVTEDMTKSIEEVPAKVEANKAAATPPAPAQPFDVGKFVGIFAAIGLAIGAIGSTIASVVGGFMGLVWWKMPFALIGLLLLVSGPSMIMAFLKLRKRNLAPILDANGWAINANVIVNIPFGNTLTHIAELPEGAKINLNDPFTKKKRPILPYILFIFILIGMALFLLWKYKFIHIPF